MENIYEAASSNRRKSYIIVMFFIAFVSLSVFFISKALSIYMGFELDSLSIVGISFIVSGLMTFVSYYYSDKIILSISKARAATKTKDLKFFSVIENLCLATGLPQPQLYVIEDSAPNAFATGRDPNHAVVCVTSGLLDKLNRSELEGVIGHELSHIKNYDIRLSSLVSVMVGVIALLADWFLRASWYGRRKDNDREGLSAIILVVGIVFAIVSPLIAQLIQLAISRRREFMADAGSVTITREPQSLINALLKISQDKEPLEVANKATAHLYFDNPFKQNLNTSRGHGAVGWFSNLFNTHPPVTERIKALKGMV